jgi:hypothetical protein
MYTHPNPNTCSCKVCVEDRKKLFTFTTVPTITDYKSFYAMKIIIPRENWFITEGERKPTISCPTCGGGLLGDNAPHGVDEDGTVHASVVCGHPGCSFHAMIQLEGWDKGLIPHR